MKRMQSEDGASAVEFAIVASLLFLLLFGIIQFGIAYNRYQGLQAGAREGARLGALPSSTVAEVEARVRDSVSLIDMSGAEACPPVDEGEYCITVGSRSNPGATLAAKGSGDRPCSVIQAPDGNATVRVDIEYRMRIQIPVLPMSPITVGASGEFRCEV
jgi:hypothetical protein